MAAGKPFQQPNSKKIYGVDRVLGKADINSKDNKSNSTQSPPIYFSCGPDGSMYATNDNSIPMRPLMLLPHANSDRNDTRSGMDGGAYLLQPSATGELYNLSA